MTGHGYLSNIDQAFPRNPLCDQILSDWVSCPEYKGIPMLEPTKIQETFLVNFSVTKIHGELYSHINAHTITIICNFFS